METLRNGQCGLCSHFGEQHATEPELVRIMDTRQASAAMLDDCGHPRHAALHLRVSAISGCDGFVPAASA